MEGMIRAFFDYPLADSTIFIYLAELVNGIPAPHHGRKNKTIWGERQREPYKDD